MTETLNEWEKHVVRKNKIAFCGAEILFYHWAFQDINHAVASVERQTRLQPARCCWKIIEKERRNT